MKKLFWPRMAAAFVIAVFLFQITVVILCVCKYYFKMPFFYGGG